MVEALVPLVGDGVWFVLLYDSDELSHDFHYLRECHQFRNCGFGRRGVYQVMLQTDPVELLGPRV